MIEPKITFFVFCYLYFQLILLCQAKEQQTKAIFWSLFIIMMCIRAKEVIFLFQDFLYSYGPLKYLGASKVASGPWTLTLGAAKGFFHMHAMQHFCIKFSLLPVLFLPTRDLPSKSLSQQNNFSFFNRDNITLLLLSNSIFDWLVSILLQDK